MEVEFQEEMDMQELHSEILEPGTLIAGRYEIVACLGSGSMGLVYSCKNKEISDHLVAIKVLYPEVAKDPIASARFRNEIFASYGVSSKHVVRAFEFVRDGDIVAYTMEYVDGGDLADRLSLGKVFPIQDCCSILKQMSQGVQAIHDAGIVHRDLKPENILLTKDGQVKIADFGIARTDVSQRLTEHGGVVGTLDYVSPEYMLNAKVDWRADIYAIGVLAYEMVTLKLPYTGDSPYDLMTQRIKHDPVEPIELRKDCPKDLSDLVMAAMSRDPESRIQSAMEIVARLEDIESGKAVSIPEKRSKKDTYVGPSLKSQEQSSKADTVDLADTIVKNIGIAQEKEKLAKHGVEINLDGTTQIIPLNAVPELEKMAETTRLRESQVINFQKELSSLTEAESLDQKSRIEKFAGPKVSVESGKDTMSGNTLFVKATRGIWLDLITVLLAIAFGLTVGILIWNSAFGGTIGKLFE